MAQDGFGRSDNNISQHDAVPQTSPQTLTNLCLIKVAKFVHQKHLPGVVDSLPQELIERVIQSALAQRILDNETLLALASPNLTNLQLGNNQWSNHPDEGAIEKVIKTCTSLEILNLRGCRLKPCTLGLLSSLHAHSLKILDLSLCDVNSHISEIILTCKNLESLDFSGCVIPKNAFLLDRVRSFCEIPPTSSPEKNSGIKRKRSNDEEKMEKYNNKNLEMESEPPLLQDKNRKKMVTKNRRTENNNNKTESNTLTNTEFIHNPEYSENPENFDIDSTHAPPKRARTSATTPISIMDIPPFLDTNAHAGLMMRHLRISGCSGITMESITHAVALFPHLTSLDCSHVPAVLDLRVVLRGLPFLRVLNINGCAIEQRGDLVDTEQNLFLEELHFSGTGTLHSPFLVLLAHCGPTLRHLQLRNKSLPPTSPTDWLRTCAALRTLDLYGVPLGRTFVPDLLHASARTTLEALDITHCTGLPSEHLDLLTHAPLPALASLTLNQPAFVDALAHVGRACPGLARLCVNLDLRGLLSEENILEMSSHFRELRELEIWCCRSLSLETILRILANSRKLKVLLLSTADPESDVPPISAEEFRILTESYPHVMFKIWHHSIYGNRHFRFHGGSEGENRMVVPKKISTLAVKPSIVQENGQSQMVPVVLVNNIPIWSNETSASLRHLRNTVVGGENSGAIPLISEWCCECNIHNYNGVLFYHDGDHVVWETHEPGIKQQFCFAKEQYTHVINNAQLDHVQLVWQQNWNNLTTESWLDG